MFIPGKKLDQILLKDTELVTIRYPRWQDLDKLLEYTNNLAQEDTYIALDNRAISRDEEIEYLSSTFKAIEQGNKVLLIAELNNKIISVADIKRKSNFAKEKHIGILGISVSKDYRGLGLGKVMLSSVIKEASNVISGLKMIVLEVFSENEVAVNLYKRFGFVEFGRLKKGLYYKDSYIDCIKMVYYLSDESN
ncbi:MAG: N-acetyltransferase [Patescibacteria group bacterium]|nr:MAG: N-acetyltransferase [Patescibacteria group bacterium]